MGEQFSLELDGYKGLFSGDAPGAFIRHYTVSEILRAGPGEVLYAQLLEVTLSCLQQPCLVLLVERY